MASIDGVADPNLDRTDDAEEHFLSVVREAYTALLEAALTTVSEESSQASKGGDFDRVKKLQVLAENLKESDSYPSTAINRVLGDFPEVHKDVASYERQVSRAGDNLVSIYKRIQKDYARNDYQDKAIELQERIRLCNLVSVNS